MLHRSPQISAGFRVSARLRAGAAGLGAGAAGLRAGVATFAVTALLVTGVTTPGFAAEPRAATLPAASVWTTRTVDSAGLVCPKCVAQRKVLQAPVMRYVRDPVYRNVRKPVFETRQVPVYRTRRVPTYEDMQIKIWATRDVPNVVTRKFEVWEDEQRPILKEVMQPAQRWVHEDIIERGEVPVRGTVSVPRFFEDCDPKTGRRVDRACGCTTVETEVGRRKIKTLLGETGSIKPRGVRPTWQVVGTRTIKKFAGVRTETKVLGTKSERYVSGYKSERRIVGHRDERTFCGYKSERVEVSATTERVCVGTRLRAVQVRTRDVTTVVGHKCEHVQVQAPGPRTVRERSRLPALRVTVVDDGTMGTPLPGTDLVMTETEYRAALAARR